MRITVLGAGVSGLTTAVALERAGHDVAVVAREAGVATTSGSAGAIWFPYRVGSPERSVAWARKTREELAYIARRWPEAGVDIIDGFVATDSETPPWWAGALDSLSLVAAPPALGRGWAWQMKVPRCDPRLYLPWLESRLRKEVTLKNIGALDELEGDCVVNCAGLGARLLVRDDDLAANLGQTLVVASDALDPGVMFSDDRDPDSLFYVIPRRGEFVVGGCAIAIDAQHPPDPDAELGQALLQACRRRGIDPGAVLYQRTGLRPVRSEVRLEREGRFLHNYGHGGAGYTLSWGCAEDVTELLRSC